MKAETLRKYYRGPHVMEDRWPTFSWTSKRRGYPRFQYTLFFNPIGRQFHLHLSTRHSSRKTHPVYLGTGAVAEPFRSQLLPEHLARCTSQSLTPPLRIS